MPAKTRRFKRVIEDFKCFNCRAEVKGTGYTDHCPKCLWSLHVDNFPGDRASSCKGKMKPVSVIYERDNFRITYVCLKCGIKKEFTAAENDSKEAMLSLIGKK